MLAILKKELKSYFTSFVGYCVVTIFYFFSALYFYVINLKMSSSSLSGVFGSMVLWIVLITSLMTMRLFSEEKKNKTDQLLMTSPVSLTSIVIGKYLASIILYFICMSIFFVYGLVIMSFGAAPVWSEFFGNIIGMLLLGATFLSIGIFFSSVTENQIIAVVCSLGTGIFWLLVESLFQNMSFASQIIKYISFTNRYTNFTHGILNFADVFFFLSLSALFIFLTVKVLDRKRWS